MLSPATTWRDRAADIAPEFIYLVEIDVGERVVFEVLDYTVGATDTATLTYNATNYTITEGTDFAAATSNAATATAMAEAWLDILPAGVNVYSLGAKVYAIIDSANTLGGSTSDSAAWSPAGRAPTLKYVTGPKPFGDYDAVVADVQPVGIEIDPIARGVARTGEREIVFVDDGPGCTIRMLLTEFPDLVGKVVRLYVGFPDIAEADFEADGIYVISEARRSAYSPGISLQLQDVAAKLEGTKIRIDVVNRHPLEAVEKILVAAGVPSALYDATTLDPTAYSDIGHWCVSRHKYGRGWNGIEGKSSGVTVEPRGSVGKRNARGVYQFKRTYPDRQDFGTITEPVDALDLLNDLLQILDGIFAPGDDGVYVFKRYDSSASAVATLTSQDFSDLDQPEKWRAAANHIEVKGPHNLNGNAILYEVEDVLAQHRRTVAGGTRQRRSLSIESEWFTGVAAMKGALASASGAGSTFQVLNAQANGFSGIRDQTEPADGGSPGTFTQDTNTTCTSGRLVYLYIFHTTDGRREIVSCNAATLLSTSPARNLGAWAIAQYTIAARGLFGTSAQDWDNTNGPAANPNVQAGAVEWGKILIADVTAAIDIADRKLARLAHGLPLVTFRAMPQHYVLELGDAIVIDAPELFDIGQDGGDEATWEIIRKEPRFLGASPGVYFQAALRGYTTSVGYVPERPIPTLTTRGTPPRNNTSLQLDGTDDYVDFGDVTTLDGVDSAIWAGWVRVLDSLHNGDVWARDDSGNEQFRLRVESAEVSLEIGAGTAKYTTTDSPISLNTWHHIVVIFDGPGTDIYIYVDGVKSTTSSTGTVPSVLPTPGSASNLRLGAQSDSPDTTYLGARVDEWMIGTLSGSAFDDDDAADYYNGGALVVPGDLANPPTHWFRFEQVVDDEIGGLLGVPAGVPFFSSDVPN